MTDGPDESILRSAAQGDPQAFEELYALYDTRLRLAAWRICGRADWIDDLVNETWQRAYAIRAQYDAGRPFLVWAVGILRNVHRESIRRSAVPPPPAGNRPATTSEEPDPARIAAEAELLTGLEACVRSLPPEDADIVRWRFFEGQSLRSVAQRLKMPEATLREGRLPAICERLRACLKARGIEVFPLLPAQGGGAHQYRNEEREGP